MATKEEFVTALTDVRKRAESMREAILAAPDTHLLGEHTWNVRDVLCHLAARAHLDAMVERVQGMVAAAPPAARPAGFNPEDVNQGQIDARQGRSVESLLDEIIDEHTAAIVMVPDLDDELLARSVTTPRGDVMLVADLLRLGTAGHDNVHLNDIEQALSAKVATG